MTNDEDLSAVAGSEAAGSVADRPSRSEREQEYKRAWRARNADRIREYRDRYDAEHRDQVLAQKREYMRRRQAQTTAEQRRRNAKRAAAKRYYESHRDQHHDYEKRWRARKLAEDPIGYRAQRAAYQRQRRLTTKDADNAKLRARRHADPERNRAAQRAYYAAHAGELAARKRAYYRDHKEEILARNRAWKEREKRRIAAGLPPRRLHRVSASDRDANDAAADEFFTRPRSRQEILVLEADARGLAGANVPTPPHLLAVFARDSERARAAHAFATDASFDERERTAEARRHAAQAARARAAAEHARQEAIGRAINDALRHREPPRRAHHNDPTAPHPMPSPNNENGLNR